MVSGVGDGSIRGGDEFVGEVGWRGLMLGASESCAAPAEAAADAKAAPAGVELAKEQVKVAEKALKMATELENNGQLLVGLNEVPKWSRRLAEGVKRSGATRPLAIEAVKDHVARMERRLALMKKLNDAGIATPIDLYNGQYDVLEAKAWLEEESGK